jgi:hypothetical protein
VTSSHDVLCACCAVLCRQWSYKVWKSQHILGSLYERIYDMIRARGVPPAEETVLWACLARLKDPNTGEILLVELSELDPSKAPVLPTCYLNAVLVVRQGLGWQRHVPAPSSRVALGCIFCSL